MSLPVCFGKFLSWKDSFPPSSPIDLDALILIGVYQTRKFLLMVKNYEYKKTLFIENS